MNGIPLIFRIPLYMVGVAVMIPVPIMLSENTIEPWHAIVGGPVIGFIFPILLAMIITLPARIRYARKKAHALNVRAQYD